MDKIILLSIILGIITIAIANINIISHENIHKQIDIYYGCTDVRVHYGIFNGQTICTEYTGLTAEKRDTMYGLHAQNEIISYNVMTLIATLILLTFLIIVANNTRE